MWYNTAHLFPAIVPSNCSLESGGGGGTGLAGVDSASFFFCPAYILFVVLFVALSEGFVLNALLVTCVRLAHCSMCMCSVGS